MLYNDGTRGLVLDYFAVIVRLLFFPVIALFLPLSFVQADDDLIKKGEQLTFSRSKGNCIACHAMPTADPEKNTLPGNVGPPLVGMKLRFPGIDSLFDRIWDASKTNPASIMPPFGKHKILTDEEIKMITHYIYTL